VERGRNHLCRKVVASHGGKRSFERPPNWRTGRSDNDGFSHQ
jgi:hypothetical protein